MKIFTKSAALFLLAMLVLSLAACGGSSIVGAWKTEAGGSSMTFEYKEDNTFILSISTDKEGYEAYNDSVYGTYVIDGDQVVTTLEGQETEGTAYTFKIKGKTLTLMDNKTGSEIVLNRQ